MVMASSCILFAFVNKKKKAFISRSNNFVSYQQFFFCSLAGIEPPFDGLTCHRLRFHKIYLLLSAESNKNESKFCQAIKQHSSCV